MQNLRSIDDAPLNRLVIRTLIYTSAGMLLDGYIMGSTAIGMSMAGSDLKLSSWWVGALTAAVLAGIFLGALVSGRVADRFGRRTVFIADLLLLLIASIGQFWVGQPGLLLVVRILIGVAIGAEYAVGSSLLAEFAPRRSRSWMLSTMTAFWTGGYVIGYLLSFAMREAGWSWQIVLGMAAAPATLALLTRIGAPESPRWQVSHGRIDAALTTVRKYYGPEYGVEDLALQERTGVRYSTLFSAPYRTRTAFAAAFWTLQVTVSFAMLLFLPTVFGALGIKSELGGNLLINATMVVGVALGIVVVQRINRRPLVIWTFVAMATFMALMAGYQVLPVWVVLLSFAVYMLVGAASGNLQFVYPPELFPTQVRSSGVGFAAACSRVGSTISTFQLPVLLTSAGATWTFLILAGVSAVGALVSLVWAPETRNLSLTEASDVGAQAEPQPRTAAAAEPAGGRVPPPAELL